jgi:hypothetical protein
MQVICCNLAALAVAAIYYTWREYAWTQLRRDSILRERVTYMLWVMAHEVA